MDFINRHNEHISGVLSCHDRIVFRGYFQPLQYVNGMMIYLWRKKVLLKHFVKHAESLRDKIIENAKNIAYASGRPYVHLGSPKQSKDEFARDIARRDGIDLGLICVISCMEVNKSYFVNFDDEEKKLKLRPRDRQCLHIYFYFMDRDFGLTYVRLQTWFPFNVQVGLNGHEYLARVLDKKGIAYEKQGNCFTYIENIKRAQRYANKLARLDWPRALNYFARRANPLFNVIGIQSYRWSCWQSELSTDIFFKDPAYLARLYKSMCCHAITNFDSDSVMRFMGRKPHGNFRGEVVSRKVRRREGVCVKHYVRSNSVKMYDKAENLLRFETTINYPGDFIVYRDIECVDTVTARKRKMKKRPVRKGWAPMRKSVVDFRRRTEISLSVNSRYMDALTVVGFERPSHEITDDVQTRLKRGKRKFRAMRPFDPEEAAFFAAIHRGEHVLNGFRNRDVQTRLFDEPPTNKKEARRRSNYVGRRLMLFRKHGLIKKMPRQRKYSITSKGKLVMATALEYRKDTTALLKLAA